MREVLQSRLLGFASLVQHIAQKGKVKGKKCWPTRDRVLPCKRQHRPQPQGIPLTLAEIDSLIARIALGDRRAFSSLYESTSAKLFGICLRVLNDRAEAEEVLQEVFVKVWHNAKRYKAGGFSPMTWLITIARNASIDRLRKRRSRKEDGGQAAQDAVQTLADPTPGPEAQAVASGERAQLAGCLNTLEPDRAEAVRRAYLMGETYEDLALRFAVPLNTMRTWLRRSLLKLKECLSQ
jgi:RNA polymerase sigma-70 factor (ECF subfamily)